MLLLLLLVMAARPSAPAAGDEAAGDDPYEELLLESSGYRAAVAARDQALATVELADRRITELQRQLDDLRVASRQLADGIPRLEDQVANADVAVDEAKADLATLAVLQYVYAGGDSLPETLAAASPGGADSARREFVIDTVAAGNAHVLATSRARRTAAQQAVELAAGDVVGIDQRIVGLEHDLEATTAARSAALTALPELGARVEDERQLSRVTGSDLTLVVVQAYFDAAKTMAVEAPDCGVRWELLAGIGRVESRHGTFGGATVALDGSVSPRIIGIALDGRFGTAVILDSDGGILDGDVVYDRAVGPMQFIPATWRAFGRDGNGDGIADPQNVTDAALSAAAYLCASGPLDTPEREVRAILRYNASMDYVRAVQGNAARYDDLGIGD